MSNKENKKVVSLKREYEGYVSLDEYNKIKYESYLKDNKIRDLEYKVNHWQSACRKMVNIIHNYNQDINNQFRYNFDYYENMRRQLTNESNQIINYQNNEIKLLKEENIKLKDKEIQRLENDNERLRKIIQKLEGDRDQLINKLIGVDDNE